MQTHDWPRKHTEIHVIITNNDCFFRGYLSRVRLKKVTYGTRTKNGEFESNLPAVNVRKLQLPVLARRVGTINW